MAWRCRISHVGLTPRRSPLLLFVLAFGLLAFGLLQPSRADEPQPKSAPLKTVPENVDDLRAIEKRVQAVVAKVTPAVVGVRVGAAQGSGVIIDKDGTVLTAGHVSGLPGRDAQIILPDGKKLKAKTLGQNKGIDSGMLKITDEGDWPAVEMGKSSDLKPGQWVVAIGHPGGYRSNRTPVVRVGRILTVNKFLIRTDCTLVGGDSGGPLFDMEGRVIGIHSRIGGAITENVHVPVDTYRETYAKLAKGESWGGFLGQQTVVQTPGGKVILETDGKFKGDDPTDSKQQDCHVRVLTLKMAPGSVYTIDMTSANMKKLDPYLRLEDSQGKQLAEDDDGGGNLNARIVFRPTREDEYRIIVTTCNPGEVGRYKVTVKQHDLRESVVAGKADVLRIVGMPKPAAPLLMDQFSKGGLSLYANATLFDAKGNLSPGRELSFRWAKGSKTVKTDANGVARLELKKGNVKDLYAEIPNDYKAAFELTDNDGNFFALNMSKDFEKEKVKSAGGKEIYRAEGQITEKEPYDKVRKECRRQVHEFRMLPGHAYTIDLESFDFDAYLRLEDSKGKQLAEDDDGAGKLNARIVFRPTTEETFRIIATTCDPGQAGAYRLTIRQAEIKTEENKE